MTIIEQLLDLNVIQIDKTNLDYSNLEKKLNESGNDKFEIIFVADKKDIENKNSELKFAKIDLYRHKSRKEQHTVTTSKDVMHKRCESKSDILDFIKKHF